MAYDQHLTKKLAEMVQDSMDKYCRDNEDFPVSSSLAGTKDTSDQNFLI